MEDFSVKSIGRDFLIILALTGVAGFYTSLAMPGKLGTIEHASMSRVLTLVLTTFGFLGIACLSPNRRWLQLLIVGALICILDGIFNLLLLGSPINTWFRNSVHIAIAVVVGGAFSYAVTGFRQPKAVGNQF